jgi:triosephosphate isomerase
MVGQLHHLLADHLFARTGSLVPCLYGGGVSLPNAAAYLDQDAVDGLFVGRAAWSAEGFIALTVMMSAAWERCAVEELKV